MGNLPLRTGRKEDVSSANKIFQDEILKGDSRALCYQGITYLIEDIDKKFNKAIRKFQNIQDKEESGSNFIRA